MVARGRYVHASYLQGILHADLPPVVSLRLAENPGVGEPCQIRILFCKMADTGALRGQ